MYNPPKMIVDMNAQILPDMGCGPESCSEAAQILVKLGEQGVTHVVAAPRFNRYDESVPHFITRRGEAMAKFSAYLSQNRMSHVPQLVMGALVSFTDNMADEPELESLCISDTNYMLVELPSVPATEELIGSFKKLACGGRVRPLLAHIEKYAAYADEEALAELFSSASGQINCDSVFSTAGIRYAARLIKGGSICGLGSGRCSLDDPPRYSEARKKLSRKLGAALFNESVSRSEAVLSNGDIIKP